MDKYRIAIVGATVIRPGTTTHSGATCLSSGKRAEMDELTIQTRQIMAGETPKPNIFPHEIAFNVLPQVDVFLDNGYTKEEWQLLEETRKILHNNDIQVSATCVRVPALKGHCQSVTLEFSDEINADIAGDILAEAPGVRVMDDTDINLYPHPRIAAGTDLVRSDASAGTF